MKLLLAAIMAGPLLLVMPAAHADTQPFLMVMRKAPQPVPALQFIDRTGKTHSLAEFKGRVVLLNIWATWCVPCRKEMPTLDRLEAALSGPDFEVVALSIDTGGLPTISEFFAEIDIKHLTPYLTSSTSGALDALGIFGLPETLLIDDEGKEIGRRAGSAEWDTPEFITFFKNIIAKQKEPPQ